MSALRVCCPTQVCLGQQPLLLESADRSGTFVISVVADERYARSLCAAADHVTSSRQRSSGSASRDPSIDVVLFISHV